MAIKGTITSTSTKYTVQRGDTFSEIAEACINVGVPGYAGLNIYNAGINKLKSFNPDIENINLIYVGQKIVLQGTPASKSTAGSQQAKITAFGLLSDDSAYTVFATWTWTKASQTEEYEILWKYSTGDGFLLTGSDSSTTDKYSTFVIPDNAVYVTFQVKPKSKTKGEKGTYFTASWSTKKTYYAKDTPPEVPEIDSSNITKVTETGKFYEGKLENWEWVVPTTYKFTVNLDLREKKHKQSDLYLNATKIEFAFRKDGTTSDIRASVDISKGSTWYKQGTGVVTYTISDKVTATDYRVRARSFRDGLYSEWSSFTDTITGQPAPVTIEDIYVASRNQNDGTYTVHVTWNVSSSKNVDKYDVAYTTNPNYFYTNPDEVTTRELDLSTAYDATGLEGGKQYFFRVRAKNSSYESEWSNIESITIGTKPAAPTTWTMRTSYTLGEQIPLYWMHNTVDGSPESVAHLYITIDDVPYAEDENGNLAPCSEGGYTTIMKPTDEYGNVTSGTSVYVINTNILDIGAKIRWSVETQGIYAEFSPRSITRAITVNSTPGIILAPGATMTDTYLLESFPLGLTITPTTSSTQLATGYHISIIALDAYDTVDDLGNAQYVSKNSEVFFRNYDVPTPSNEPREIQILPNEVNLDNNQSYKLTCTASFDSGLTAEESITFTVAWLDAEYWVNAEILYDSDTYAVTIRPYCENFSGSLVSNVTLAVYRHEYDGGFTKIASGLVNTDCTYVTDPHPSLNYARYRVVATDTTTGAVSFYDIPSFEIGEKAVIMQWDEEWSNFNLDYDNAVEEPAWSGSLLRLPYNIDVSDSYSPDVELIEYIGREAPVSYYGTHIGHSSAWGVEIPKTDTETLYALRRLARWMGNVYVREPSGSGYWANVKVSFSQTHCELTIPVTFSITKVEGEENG